MITNINYKNENLAGAKLYTPDEPSDVLLVWAGGGFLNRWDLESLGKHISKGEIRPKCNVLMPYCRSGHSLAEVSTEDARLCIYEAFRAISHEVSLFLCGYSMGSNAIQKWLDGGIECGKFVLISNFPHGWYKSGKVPLDVPARFYFGGAEKSHVQPWGKLCDMFEDADYKPVGRLNHSQMANKFWLSPEGRGLMEWMEDTE